MRSYQPRTFILRAKDVDGVDDKCSDASEVVVCVGELDVRKTCLETVSPAVQIRGVEVLGKRHGHDLVSQRNRAEHHRLVSNGQEQRHLHDCERSKVTSGTCRDSNNMPCTLKATHQ